jgi:BirA family transcriptional regulator, biotin operon repressor / biotin---[acetyl-CoA-carboxylase] ligase
LIAALKSRKSTRDKLLQALEGKAGCLFSGHTLSHLLNISRTAVWKQIQKLKHDGLPIESAGRQGYRLRGVTDASLLGGGFPAWVRGHYFFRTASTQILAKAGAEAHLPEGHLWLAEVQSGGRGRLDRRWESTYGGLYFSMLLRPRVLPKDVTALALVISLTLKEAIRDVCGIESRLKWPNDLVARRSSDDPWKKMAGILTEMSGQVDRTDWVVVGVGLNVNNRLPPGLSPRAVSLQELGDRAFERGEILRKFLVRFRRAYTRFQASGFRMFRDAYWRSSSRPNEPVRLQTARGLVRGRVRGVDDAGGLLVETASKIETLTEGEII